MEKQAKLITVAISVHSYPLVRDDNSDAQTQTVTVYSFTSLASPQICLKTMLYFLDFAVIHIRF
jgi:hypothetical protein